MNIFDRVVQGSIFGDIWSQLQKYLFTEKRWLQLLTLKPIEIYTSRKDIIIDGAKIDLNIKAYIENIMQKRLSSVKNYLTLGFLNWKSDIQTYKFNIVVKAKTDYGSVGNFFNYHFANKLYPIEENAYSIILKEFLVRNNGTKAQIEIPFVIYTKKWYLKKQYEGVALFSCSLVFNNPIFTVKTRNLSYQIKKGSIFLKWINALYYQRILDFLNGFLVYNFREELYLAKLEAQNQLNEFQVEKRWINGNILEIQLERITIDHDALRAVFLAYGRLEVNN